MDKQPAERAEDRAEATKVHDRLFAEAINEFAPDAVGDESQSHGYRKDKNLDIEVTQTSDINEIHQQVLAHESCAKDEEKVKAEVRPESWVTERLSQ